jgi:hypothetical protein
MITKSKLGLLTQGMGADRLKELVQMDDPSIDLIFITPSFKGIMPKDDSILDIYYDVQVLNNRTLDRVHLDFITVIVSYDHKNNSLSAKAIESVKVVV